VLLFAFITVSADRPLCVRSEWSIEHTSHKSQNHSLHRHWPFSSTSKPWYLGGDRSL